MRSNHVTIIIIACLLAAPCLARPPKVIKMTPENGAVDVKPGPIKIRILFDQDMGRGSSLCGGGENFPDIVGEPKWASRRAFVFSARLKPNHDYSFGVNCPSAQNFKSIRGESAKVLFVNFRTSGLGGKPPTNITDATKNQNQQAIDKLRKAIDNNYSYKDEKDIDWDELFGKYKDSLLNAASTKDFAKNTGLMLAHAKDKHIWLKVNGEHVSAYRNPVTPNANLKLLPKLVPNFKKHNANVCTGRFPDGIGYIYIDSWSRHRKEDYEQTLYRIK